MSGAVFSAADQGLECGFGVPIPGPFPAALSQEIRRPERLVGLVLCAGLPLDLALRRPERLTLCGPSGNLPRRAEPEAEALSDYRASECTPDGANGTVRTPGGGRRRPELSRRADVRHLSVCPRAPIRSRPCHADQVPVRMTINQLDRGVGGPPDAIVAVHDRLRHATLTGEDGLVPARDGLEVSAAPGRGRDAFRLCGRGEGAESEGNEQAR